MEKVVIEHQTKRPIWDYLFYLSLLVLTIWLILKVTGFIHTPLWLEYGVPIGSAIITMATFFQSMESRMSKMEVMIMHHDRDLERLKDDMSIVRSKLHAV